MRVGAITDDASPGKKNVKIEAIEYKRTIDSLNDFNVAPGFPGSVGTIDWGDNGGGTPAPLGGPIVQTINWFNAGGTFTPNHPYTINYVSGSYVITPTGTACFCAGYNIVTLDSTGALVILAAAPTVADPGGGYANGDLAQIANAGQTTTVTLSAVGLIGIQKPVSMTAIDNGEGPVRFDCIA
jgi:hypothetical protein